MENMENNQKVVLGIIILVIIFSLIVLISQKYVKESYKNKYYSPHNFKSFKKKKAIHPENELIPPNTSDYNFPQQKHVENEKIENKIIDGSNNFPSVDGTSKEFRSLNMFSFNEKKPSCCGQSPYFGSGGCYCITNGQRDFLNKNGIRK